MDNKVAAAILTNQAVIMGALAIIAESGDVDAAISEALNETATLVSKMGQELHKDAEVKAWIKRLRIM